jgi:3-hydroxyisobutyrate dehydrogenase
MATIGFIGLGNMGAPMAANLVKAGHQVTGFDIVAGRAEALAAKGGRAAATPAEAATAGEVVITMLPAGPDVRAVYLGNGGVLGRARKDALLIDCSTIDVETARDVAADAADAGFDMLDAPVSGGVIGAETAVLTFMVGGSVEAFERARPLLAAMGRTIVHAGPAGNGQAAKICNNMILGISMIGYARLSRSPSGWGSRLRLCSTSAPNPPANAGPSRAIARCPGRLRPRRRIATMLRASPPR